MSTKLRTTFEELIRRAGLASRPRLFHNMQVRCETDLMQHHPIHVVTAWIGNTPKIALGHYLQTLDADFEKAVQGGAESGAVVVQNAAQSRAAASGQEEAESTEVQQERGLEATRVTSSPLVPIRSDGQGGARTPLKSPCETALSSERGAESGALAPEPFDPDLSRVVAAWPTLPDPIKAAIRALIGAGS